MGRRLAGKTAIVTAAAQGIGRATALAFAAEGAEVFATDINAAKVAEIAGPGLRTGVLDVMDPAAIAALAARLGPVDIVFNCAGFVHQGSVLDATEAEWDFAFDLNVRSMFRMIRAFVPGMIGQGGGSVINMSSIFALIGTHKKDAYTAAKGAISALTRSMAVEYAANKVRVNAIAPGATGTERVLKLLQRDGVTNKSLDGQLFGIVPPKDVAYAALFLASDESASTTGHILSVDGGLTIS